MAPAAAAPWPARCQMGWQGQARASAVPQWRPQGAVAVLKPHKDGRAAADLWAVIAAVGGRCGGDGDRGG